MNRTSWKVDVLSDTYGLFEVRKRMPLKEANLIGSQLAENPRLHAPVLDLDIPHVLVPSSTPGHAHLYLDVAMSWRKYKRLLRALAAAGVIEKGFCRLSIKRKCSFVRKPGVKK